MNFQPNKTYIVGVLNVTPDSFSDGGQFDSFENAIKHAKLMEAQGTDIIDIGGESTRPGSDPVSAEEEMNRVLPIIERLKKEISIPISIDSYKPEVINAALAAGASIINDVTGLTNPDMIAVAAKWQLPVILMHMQGKPKSMQKEPHYEDVVAEIKIFFEGRIAAAKEAGIKQLILDPGIGFGKKLEHNLLILKHLQDFTALGYPIMVGPSRKSFINMIATATVENRLGGTIAAICAARLNGAKFMRVHDVAECKQAMQVMDAILNA
ncbi:MAG: hypothetical protein ACD_72C00440G0003 [uncultured bacterium]|nr:MAG: hypothetical protein ACD_72C00440G0003 [uncultured bacterium]